MTDSKLSQKGSVTIEDGDDDDEYEVDEHEFAQVSKSSSNSSRNSSSVNSTSSAAAKKSDGPDNTNRGGLSPGSESSFEVWLRHNVNEPLLAITPEWVTPNSISYVNTAVCWTAFFCSYLAYKFEHIYPVTSCFLRVFMGLLIFLGISLDCLDGMQARKTNRCSKLGEVLDHSLDAANVPIIGCCVLMTIYPDIYTVVISVVGGSMIYNAQLVIYRHHHVFVLPPVTGPAAQAMASAASILFGIFFLFFSRHSYFVQIFITLFAMVGNIGQFSNCHFYFKHLRYSFEQSCVFPHVRFTIVMSLHGLLLLFGLLTPAEYMFSAIILAYRLNGKYVLDTLMDFKPFTASHTKEQVYKEDNSWRLECVSAILILLGMAALGYGPHVGSGAHVIHMDSFLSLFHLPFLAYTPFHLAMYTFISIAIALNVTDLIKAVPILAAK